MKALKPIINIVLLLFFLSAAKAQVPQLSSYTTAPATIFLDFDGQYVTGTSWNWYGPIDAQPAGLSTEVITEIFNRVAEDFRPFNLNVTTDSTYYWNAPVFQRMRIIVTPTYQWYVPAGGVAFVGSFRFGDNTPAWVFSSLLANSPKTIAEAISHEAGHTLGLQHQSDFDVACTKIREYSSGAGTGEIGWAPIMGISYNRNLTTWHNGTSTIGCTSFQDDFAIINSAMNGFGLRPDDHLNDNTNATPVDVSANAFLLNGLINNSSDIDFFKLTLAAAANVSLEAIPENVGPGNSGANIDIKVALLHPNGDTIARYNPTSLLNAAIDTVLNAGDYYFVVDGTSNMYHSDYGSMGYYTLKGFVGNVTLPVTNFSLRAQNLNGKHLLTWSYQADETIESIILESSADGITFSPFATVESSAKHFLNSTVINTPLYYRAKAVTAKNKKAYLSDIARIHSTHKQKKIQLIAAPGSREIVVYSTQAFNYQLFNTNMQLIRSGKLVAGTNQIEAPGTKGLLILHCTDGKSAFSEKIVQQ